MEKINPIDFLFHIVKNRIGVSDAQLDHICEVATDEELEALFDDDMEKIKVIVEKYKIN